MSPELPTVPPHTDSWSEAVTHGYYGPRTDPLPDSIYDVTAPEVAPTVTSIVPSTGNPETVTYASIMGTLLFSPVITFGGATVTVDYVYPDGTMVNVTVPPHAAGPVDVVVTTPGGTVTVEDGFTYEVPPPPAEFTVTPNTGPAAGGTAVNLWTGGGPDGKMFETGNTVTFGGVAAEVTNNNVNNNDVITPAGSGVVDIVVSHSQGDKVVTGGYTYT